MLPSRFAQSMRAAKPRARPRIGSSGGGNAPQTLEDLCVNQDRFEKRESGAPCGGVGRKDDVGRSGVYPISRPHPAGDAPIVTPAAWGRRGGYGDHGQSELSIPRVTPEKCRDIMTKDPVCCLASDSVSAAARLMREHDFGALPVVADREGKVLVGIVTDRDLALRVAG
jgi:CBS domain-containing protein